MDVHNQILFSFIFPGQRVNVGKPMTPREVITELVTWIENCGEATANDMAMLNKAREVAKNSAAKKKSYVRAESFQTVSFYDPKEQRQIVVLYSLGEDGIIREYINQQWIAFPIEEH
jgi:hypothetical protein